MVNSVIQTPTTSPIKATTAPKTTRTSIFYINDEHCYIPNMEKLKSAYDTFDKTISDQDADKLVLLPGDIAVGAEPKLSKVALEFENEINTMASAIGNHELDLDETTYLEIIKNAKYKVLAFNINPDPSSEISKRITKSYIQEKNGTKYGIIGLAPFDLYYHLKDADRYKHLNLMTIDETIPKLQKQIDDFKAQGIDKIIIVSHAGYDDEVKIAKSVEGIDVILGGHSHHIIKGIKEGKNLFYSKKTGEPTIITQAGKEGRYFGVLNLEFNDKGIITKAQNNVSKSENFPRDFETIYMVNQVLGKAQIVGKINSASKMPANSLAEENANLEFIADAVKSELGVDVAMVNSGNIRSYLDVGPVTDREISGLTPFHNRMCIVPLNEKDLVDAIKVGTKSLVAPDSHPGLLQFSGLDYTVNRFGELEELYFIDKSGNKSPIDINNPNPFKIYTVAMDEFVAKCGNDYFAQSKWEGAIKQFDFDKDKIVIDYIKKQTKPIDIQPDGRLKVVE